MRSEKAGIDPSGTLMPLAVASASSLVTVMPACTVSVCADSSAATTELSESRSTLIETSGGAPWGGRGASDGL